MFGTFENQLLKLYCKKSWNYNGKSNCWFIYFSYFANWILTLDISKDKRFLNVIFVNDVFILFVMYVIV